MCPKGPPQAAGRSANATGSLGKDKQEASGFRRGTGSHGSAVAGTCAQHAGTDGQTERHVLELEARLRHADELIAEARQKGRAQREDPGAAKRRARIEELARERDRLVVRLDELRLVSPEQPGAEEIQAAGPMGIWNAGSRG